MRRESLQPWQPPSAPRLRGRLLAALREEVTDEVEWQTVAGWIESAPETFALVLDTVAGATMTIMREQVRGRTTR